MDWLTFVADITGAVVWPSVVVVLLLLLRDHFGGLTSRLSEVSFPGGKAKFSAQLDAARSRSEPILAKGSKPRRARATGSVDDDGYLVLARTFPEAAVMEAFKEIDGVIMEYWDRMPGDKKVRMDALRPLLNEKLVSRRYRFVPPPAPYAQYRRARKAPTARDSCGSRRIPRSCSRARRKIPRRFRSLHDEAQSSLIFLCTFRFALYAARSEPLRWGTPLSARSVRLCQLSRLFCSRWNSAIRPTTYGGRREEDHRKTGVGPGGRLL
jgi:hypothetical protein